MPKCVAFKKKILKLKGCGIFLEFFFMYIVRYLNVDK